MTVINIVMSNYRQPTGGGTYNQKVADYLSENYDIKYFFKGKKIKRGAFYYNNLLNTFRFFCKNSITVYDFNSLLSISPFTQGKKIVILHHFDFDQSKKKRKLNILWNHFLSLKNKITVVVVSQYWKNYLSELGFTDVVVIYNSFNIEEYHPNCSRNSFLKKYKLDNRPILYLGKNEITKTKVLYDYLKELNIEAQLVTSGFRKEFEGPIHLNLDAEDYINLLCYTSLTLLFTQFNEGWSRVAHESILCGTPVLGNGSGGMKELLEYYKLPVFRNLLDLKSALTEYFSNPEKLQMNKNQHISFSEDVFYGKWNNLVQTIFEKG